MREPELYERPFLEGAERQAGLVGLGFHEHVQDRLAIGERLGYDFTEKTLRQLVQELREEGLDVGAWGVLFAQHPDMAELDDERRLQVAMLLQRAVSKGAEIENLSRQISDLLTG